MGLAYEIARLRKRSLFIVGAKGANWRVDLIHLRHRRMWDAGRPLFSCVRGDGFLANICELLRVTGTAPLGRKADNILVARAESPTS